MSNDRVPEIENDQNDHDHFDHILDRKFSPQILRRNAVCGSLRNKNSDLFVAIMPVGREYVNVNFHLKDAINKPVLFSYLTTPSTFWLTFQWLWMTQPRLGCS